MLLSGVCLGGRNVLLRADTLEIPVAQYRTVRFEVRTEQSTDASLMGHVRISPDTASLEMILFHIDDYQRWSSSGSPLDSEPVDTLAYLSTGSGDFSIDVPGLGRYALVVSNRGNYRPAMAVLELDIVYAGTGSGDPLPSAMKMALLLIALGAVAFAVISVIIKSRK